MGLPQKTYATRRMHSTSTKRVRTAYRAMGAMAGAANARFRHHRAHYRRNTMIIDHFAEAANAARYGYHGPLRSILKWKDSWE